MSCFHHLRPICPPLNPMECGIFWSVEGTGMVWPGADGAILGLLIVLTLVSLGLVALLRRMQQARQALRAANVAGMGA